MLIFALMFNAGGVLGQKMLRFIFSDFFDQGYVNIQEKKREV